MQRLRTGERRPEVRAGRRAVSARSFVLNDGLSHIRSFVLLLSLYSTQPLHAADENQQFAIKGIGLSNCKSFVEAREHQSPQYFQFGGWMNGYLSAANRYEQDTFDLVPWQSTGMLTASLADFCERNPGLQFVRAVALLLNTLGPDRLQVESDLIDAKVGETSVVIYRATLQRAQKKLVEQQHLVGEPSGEFDDATRQALLGFQEASGLEPTGLPDQATLLQLFK